MIVNKDEFENLKKSVKTTLLNEVGKCEYCGYNKFKEILEIAHIKHGITVEGLRLSNLFLLCPTCHTAFDRGFIKVKGLLSDSQFSCRKIEVAKQNKIEVWKDNGTGKIKLGR